MKYKYFTFEEKIKFFNESAWDSGDNWDNANFPEKYIVRSLSNDELIEKYLIWINNNHDKDADTKYWKGMASHLRHEMARRLKEGLEKYEKTKPEATTVKEGNDINKDAEIKNLNAEIKNSHSIIKKIRADFKSQKLLAKRPSREEMFTIVDNCRKKNKSIHYSKLMKELGVTDKTAKKWCIDYGIK